MFKQPKKTILIIAALIVLLLTSEGLYQMQNNSNAQILYHLITSHFFARTSNVQSSVKHFEKAYEFRLEQLSYQNSQESKKEEFFPGLPENQMLVSEYKLVLESLELNKLTSSYDTWGKVFYNLGLLAYKNGELNLVIPFWQKAVAIAPEWSYFHIELANYYLVDDQKDKATAQIDYCFKFKSPKSFCQWYIDNHLEMRKPDKVGFLEGKINDEI